MEDRERGDGRGCGGDLMWVTGLLSWRQLMVLTAVLSRVSYIGLSFILLDASHSD